MLDPLSRRYDNLLQLIHRYEWYDGCGNVTDEVVVDDFLKLVGISAVDGGTTSFGLESSPFEPFEFSECFTVFFLFFAFRDFCYLSG